MQAAQAHYHRAFALLSSPAVTRAFDLTREPAAVRERYGMNIHGQSVLQARRLVEAGVPLVTVFWPNDGITNVSVYWDTHSRNFIDLKERLCPVTDQAFSALLDDLEARGMLDETLIVWTGEMGRTPRVGQSVVGGAGAGKDGRDHWPHCFTSVLAGGGIKGGIVYGSSDRYAAYPATNPVSPADLAATVYHCLGVDPQMTIRDKLNRPHDPVRGRADSGHPVEWEDVSLELRLPSWQGGRSCLGTPARNRDSGPVVSLSPSPACRSCITGAALVGLPILLHLIMRQEPKRLPFPAFRFLKTETPDQPAEDSPAPPAAAALADGADRTHLPVALAADDPERRVQSSRRPADRGGHRYRHQPEHGLRPRPTARD